MAARLSNPRISALFKSACAECVTAGVVLLPEDFVFIYDAAARTIDSGNECPALVEVPVKVGNVTLYPRTLGASLWWKKYGNEWYGGKADADEVVALAWLLAHSRDRAALESCTARWRASAAILAWQIGIAWKTTVGELAWGIDRLFGQRDYFAVGNEKKELDSASSVDWGGAVARLCATYHRPPEYFLWGIGEGAAIELLEKAPLPDGTCRDSAKADGRAFAEFRETIASIKRERIPQMCVEG